MCCASLRLFFGALLVLAVENEATNTTNSSDLHVNNTNINTTNTTTNVPVEFTTATSPPQSAENQTTGGNITSMTELASTTSPTKNNGTTTNVNNLPQTTTKKLVPTSTTDKKTTSVHSTKAPTHKTEPGYIVVIIAVILCLIGIGCYCFFHKKNEIYSLEVNSKREDAQIPLSMVDAEVFDTTSEKDLQTFTPVASSEPVKDSDPAKEAEKHAEGKETADVKQENQNNTTETPKDKTEELTVVDLTDGDPAISTKTSMESLDDLLNENNSNNTEVNGIVNEFTLISLDGLL